MNNLQEMLTKHKKGYILFSGKIRMSKVFPDKEEAIKEYYHDPKTYEHWFSCHQTGS